MAAKKPALQIPEICPVCGEDVPPKALACPECGADYRSGWKSDANTYDAADLPEETFDYDDFVEREFGKSVKPSEIHWLWWVTALALLVILLVTTFR